MEGGRSPGEQGVGEGGKWENRGRGESGSRNKEGDSLLFITGINQSKILIYSKVLKTDILWSHVSVLSLKTNIQKTLQVSDPLD